MGGLNPSTGVALETWENTFSVKNNQLICNLWTKSTDTESPDTVLVDGVTNLQIVYGVNTKGGSSATNSCVDTYMTSSAMVAAPANWPNVCTVTVTLTFQNPAPAPGGAATVQFTRTIAVMNMVGVNL
jgi:hypothetical protein